MYPPPSEARNSTLSAISSGSPIRFSCEAAIAASTSSAGMSQSPSQLASMAPGEIALTRISGEKSRASEAGESPHGALCRAVPDGDRVDEVVLVESVPVGAREVDDDAAAVLAQVRLRRLADPHRPQHVDVEQLADVLDVSLLEADGVGDVDPAGGVDEHVEPAVLGDGVLDELLHAGGVRDVDLGGVSPSAGLDDRGHIRLRGLLRAPVAEGDRRPLPGKAESRTRLRAHHPRQ